MVQITGRQVTVRIVDALNRKVEQLIENLNRFLGVQLPVRYIRGQLAVVVLVRLNLAKVVDPITVLQFEELLRLVRLEIPAGRTDDFVEVNFRRETPRRYIILDDHTLVW